MASSTRDRFQAAINAAATSSAAAGMVNAIHLADMRELFQELEANDTPSGYFITETDFHRLKAEYTA